VDFEQVLKEVVWRLVTEGSASYRRMKRSFGLDDDALEDVRRVLIGALHIALSAGWRRGRLDIFSLTRARETKKTQQLLRDSKPDGPRGLDTLHHSYRFGIPARF
jgi:hypothetical protein